MKVRWKIFKIVLVTLFCNGKDISCKNTFVVSFQSGNNGGDSASTDEWIEFLSTVPSSKEFTACQWIKPKYINLSLGVNLWSYCTMETVDDTMKCLQMWLDITKESAGRDLTVNGWFPWKNEYKTLSMDVKPFLHRSWAHFCWSLSSISGEGKFYYNGKLLGIYNVMGMENQTIINSAGEMFDVALIFGQEPDSMRGGYDKFQAFIGDLTELNIWNHIVGDEKLTEIAQCKDNGAKGNVVAWEKANLKAHNVVLKDLKDASSLCFEHHNFVIFPQKVIYSQAKRVCAIHGGKLALPKSEEENAKIMEIVLKHKKKCIEGKNLENKKAVWIGAREVNHVWYDVKSNGSHGNAINYTKWFTHIYTYGRSNCSYLRTDGYWEKGLDFTCTMDTICTICSIMNTPVFTIKGLCYSGTSDWNYYLALDNINQVESFDGYKDTNLIPTEDTRSWKFSPKVGTYQDFFGKVLFKNSSINYPIGRKDWLINEPNCGIEQQVETMAMSICNFGTEFTCDSGYCIDINKRCDENYDCLDGSDEKFCSLVNVPFSYKKDNPPKTNNSKVPLELHTQITIINIDSIDTVNMIVGLTIEISMKWLDERLTFSNPTMNRDNILSAVTGRQLWLPLDRLIHENAIIGEVKSGNVKRIQLLPAIQADWNADFPIENRLFSGSHNPLVVSRRMKIKYNCIFDVKKFPFDDDLCHFVMGIQQHKNTAISFVKDGNILYNGAAIVDQFSIGSIHIRINNTNRHAEFSFAIPMIRIFTNQLLTTFLPTFLLWLFGYSTLFIDIEQPSDRFMGSGTALLVIVTLLNAINNDLPKTSYVKLIDLWFVWHILNISAIITFHIILDRIRKYSEKSNDNEVHLFAATDDEHRARKEETNKICWINKIAIIVFPFLTSIFYGIYLYFTLN